MAGATILDLMNKKDLNVLSEGVKSGDPVAVAFLEACFDLELENTVPGTEEATAAMVLASFERALGLDQESQADTLAALQNASSLSL
jgi:hypothetical protein